MKLFVIVFAINFREGGNFALEDSKLKFLDFISEGSFDAKKLIHTGVNVMDSKTKTTVVLEEQKLAISVEEDSLEKASTRLFEVLNYIYENYPYTKKSIERIGLRTQWYEQWGSSFTKLCQQYKDVFYKQTSIVNESKDIAINLTLKDQDALVNYITGPMKKDQGKSQLNFKERHLPPDFIFVDIDRYLLNYQNSIENITSFIEHSIGYEEEKAVETINLLARS